LSAPSRRPGRRINRRSDDRLGHAVLAVIAIGSHKMANTSSAKKAARKIAHRTLINVERRSRMRTYLRAVEDAITAGDAKKAQAALAAAEPHLMRAARKGVIHRNAASRKVSRLANRVRKLGG
jgi:small subunit ribosomal protein S20